jgi:hypothetical protein
MGTKFNQLTEFDLKTFYKALGIFLLGLMAYANYQGWTFIDTIQTGRIGQHSYRTYHK